MRESRRTGRLALAVAAATLAGLLTAWADPVPNRMDGIRRDIAAVVRDARGEAAPALTVVDQALPVARTMVSRNQ